MENFFDYIIVFAPIIGYIPQIYKVIKNKSDLGFNTLRISFLLNSIIIEFFLNLEYNLKNNDYSFHKYARTFSLIVAFIGVIIKMIIKTIYSHNSKLQLKHNIINLTLILTYSCIFLPIILLTSNNLIIMLSIFSSILNFCNYIPQIRETCKLKRSGSLSYLAVIFDYIGNIIIFIYGQTDFLILCPIIIVNISITIQLSLMYYYDFYLKKKIKNYNMIIEMVELNHIEISEH
tara:strand:- start:1473 stop:2171 length:699 start_codon:yes stop_codon:yes gene_type:complete